MGDTKTDRHEVALRTLVVRPYGVPTHLVVCHIHSQLACSPHKICHLMMMMSTIFIDRFARRYTLTTLHSTQHIFLEATAAAPSRQQEEEKKRGSRRSESDALSQEDQHHTTTRSSIGCDSLTSEGSASSFFFVVGCSNSLALGFVFPRASHLVSSGTIYYVYCYYIYLLRHE